jgi:excisionase family DNA binding protein
MDTKQQATTTMWAGERIDLLRPEDVAKRLQVGRSKVYDLMRCGQLRSVKVGGSRRVTLAALAEFVAALDRGSGGEPAA